MEASLLPDLALVLRVHPGSLFAMEGLGELLRVGEDADHAEARGAVRVVQDLEKNQKLTLSFCLYFGSIICSIGCVNRTET